MKNGTYYALIEKKSGKVTRDVDGALMVFKARRIARILKKKSETVRKIVLADADTGVILSVTE